MPTEMRRVYHFPFLSTNMNSSSSSLQLHSPSQLPIIFPSKCFHSPGTVRTFQVVETGVYGVGNGRSRGSSELCFSGRRGRAPMGGNPAASHVRSGAEGNAEGNVGEWESCLRGSGCEEDGIRGEETGDGKSGESC